MPNFDVKKPGRLFELAVYEFAKALNPASQVIFDHKVLDRDTGALRQVDVWINATIGGHIPYTVLISCKDKGRKLGPSDIEGFIGEVHTTSASYGVIYSSAGFTKTAEAKAAKHGIACCRLYLDQPADIPRFLLFRMMCARPIISFSASLDSVLQGTEPTGRAQLNIVTSDGTTATLGDAMTDNVICNEGQMFRDRSSVTIYKHYKLWEFECKLAGTDCPITVEYRWQCFECAHKATLLRGSYSISNTSFAGTQFFPTLSLCGEKPGPGWAEVGINELDHTAENVSILVTGKRSRDGWSTHIGAELSRTTFK